MGRVTVSDWWLRLVRFGFYLLYNQLAWTYDFVSWIVSLGEWRRWQFAALPFVKGRKVLEIAHGTGHLLQAMQHAGHHVIGLDLSPYMSHIAQRRTDNIPLLQASALRLPFPNAQFDTVVTTFPTSFILELDTLNAIRRCLKPTGRLLVVPEGHLLGGSLLHQLIAWLFRITGQQMEAATVWDDWHTQFAAAGFELTIHNVKLSRSAVTVLIGRPIYFGESHR